MKMPTERLAAFSDAVIAIIITIMVLEIPLPEAITNEAIIEFLESIGIYFVSFMVVGVQWNRHHALFHNFKEGTQQIFWRNILYLFFLSLIPIFTRWIMENPGEVAPVFGYSLVYMLTMLSFYFMKFRLIKDNPDSEVTKAIQEIRAKQLGSRGSENAEATHVRRVILIMVAILIGLTLCSYYYPKIGVLLFLVFPICSSIFNMWSDSPETRIRLKEELKNHNDFDEY